MYPLRIGFVYGVKIIIQDEEHVLKSYNYSGVVHHNAAYKF